MPQSIPNPDPIHPVGRCGPAAPTHSEFLNREWTQRNANEEDKITDRGLRIEEKADSSFSSSFKIQNPTFLFPSMFDVPFTPQSPITNNSSPSSFQLFSISAFQLLPHTPL
jgi:hypothetical protein